MPSIDNKDRLILAERLALMNCRQGPRVGDWIRFADGTVQRIGIWCQEAPADRPWLVQTVHGEGHFYLNAGGYLECSAAFHSGHGLEKQSLTLTEDLRMGGIWIFHHGFRHAGNGIDLWAPFRVFACEMNAPK